MKEYLKIFVGGLWVVFSILVGSVATATPILLPLYMKWEWPFIVLGVLLTIIILIAIISYGIYDDKQRRYRFRQ